MKVNIEKSWLKLLESEFNKKYFFQLTDFIENEYKSKDCYPPKDLIFSAFNKCSLDKVKVVILGQDPYHGLNQANGLCFSVKSGMNIPPSLLNIFKEIKSSFNDRSESDLSDWANQGVLLLNSILTVEEGLPGSHSEKGWEEFTKCVIKLISDRKQNIVFMLWGGYAKKKESLIDSKKHLILKSGHPSPMSANRGYWLGNKHFSKCNDYLKENGMKVIYWS
ncbi:MAG: uracil-DNA glycosylase [Bacteroidetes bacterium]|nr:uracil-DNA glycosylase [Bacteroidota bacterium]MDA1019191.1 uracil-DNA glycosylase [Bacteroidota bacterium]